MTLLEQCIASGQVSAAQVEAHRQAGDLAARPAGLAPARLDAHDAFENWARNHGIDEQSDSFGLSYAVWNAAWKAANNATWALYLKPTDTVRVLTQPN